jgi:hypothetical protein
MSPVPTKIEEENNICKPSTTASLAYIRQKLNGARRKKNKRHEKIEIELQMKGDVCLKSRDYINNITCGPEPDERKLFLFAVGSAKSW